MSRFEAAEADRDQEILPWVALGDAVAAGDVQGLELGPRAPSDLAIIVVPRRSLRRKGSDGDVCHRSHRLASGDRRMDVNSRRSSRGEGRQIGTSVPHGRR